MKKKQVKLTGKEQAKLNKRKKFYDKLTRLTDNKVILIKMNKGISFPEFDELSIIFKEDFVKFEAEINFEEIKYIEIVYYEEAHFLLNASKSKFLSIVRRETFVDNQGNERKGQSGTDESYKYQMAFNWGIEVKNAKKFLSLLEKEKEEPSIYDLTPKAAIIPEPIHRKSWKPPRRRRR